MIWLLAGAGVVGLLLGLRFRIAPVVAASALIFAGTLIAIPVVGLSPWITLAAGFGALCTLQGGYLVGLVIWSRAAASRARRPPHSAGGNADDDEQAQSSRQTESRPR